MSSREGASQNRTTAKTTLIQICHECLEKRDFIGVRFMDLMNLRNECHDQFEKARAISDVLHAAENPLPNGLMDYYGMIRMTGPRPVLKEDFMKLMKLLDGRQNPFPLNQEAADKAMLAWSMLSNPHIKAQYDLAISTNHERETQGNGRGYSGIGGSQSDDVFVDEGLGYGCSDVGFGDDGTGSNCGGFFGPDCSTLHESDTSFIPKKHNVGPGIDDEAVIISDDDDENDEGQEIMTIARTAKLCKINGRRVKLIPLKKKQRCKRL